MVLYDPAHMNVLPASALMFHRRDVKEAMTGYYERIAAGEFMDPAFAPKRNSRLALLGKYGLVFADVAEARFPANPDLLKQASDKTKQVYDSVTGEIRWDLNQGLLRIDSPRTQGVVGFTQGQTVATSDVTFEIGNEFAVVVVSCPRWRTDPAVETAAGLHLRPGPVVGHGIRRAERAPSRSPASRRSSWSRWSGPSESGTTSR